MTIRFPSRLRSLTLATLCGALACSAESGAMDVSAGPDSGDEVDTRLVAEDSAVDDTGSGAAGQDGAIVTDATGDGDSSAGPAVDAAADTTDPDAPDSQGTAADGGDTTAAGDTASLACPPPPPYGWDIGDTVGDLTYLDCEGNPVSFHDTCGANATLIFNYFGW